MHKQVSRLDHISALLKGSALLLLIALMSSLPVAAEQAKSADKLAAPVAQEKAADAPINQLAWIVGHWRVAIPAQNGNPAVTVDAHMSWSDNRRAIIFQVYFTSEGKREPHYYGMYAWDPGERVLKMVQVASDGNLSVGKATMEGNLFKQDTHMTRANGTTQEQHTEIVRDGNDAYNWKVQLQKDGQWVDALKLRYERVKDAANTSGGVQ
jgi:hypothetical protein